MPIVLQILEELGINHPTNATELMAVDLADGDELRIPIRLGSVCFADVRRALERVLKIEYIYIKEL